jgi:hypothetical protein
VFHQWIAAWSEPAVTDDMHSKAVAAGDAFNLVLHRTGIAIDKNLKHEFSSTRSFA